MEETMVRYLWIMLLFVAILHLAAPVAAGDRLQTRALGKTLLTPQAGISRSCTEEDVAGNWHLIGFDSRYRFRDPHAAYLFPYQIFQYSKEGGVKSVHSTKPITEPTNETFNAIPPAMSYRLQLGGIMRLSKQGQEGVVETWRCVVLTEGYDPSVRQRSLQRGDLMMTLLGRDGQRLFIRHLRKLPT
jgi:hypothetical protein